MCTSAVRRMSKSYLGERKLPNTHACPSERTRTPLHLREGPGHLTHRVLAAPWAVAQILLFQLYIQMYMRQVINRLFSQRILLIRLVGIETRLDLIHRETQGAGRSLQHSSRCRGKSRWRAEGRASFRPEATLVSRALGHGAVPMVPVHSLVFLLLLGR